MTTSFVTVRIGFNGWWFTHSIIPAIVEVPPT